MEGYTVRKQLISSEIATYMINSVSRMTNLTSSVKLDREDFETEASKIRTKIETHFSQLIEVIQLRKNTLISELDELLSSCKKRRYKSKNKMRELEKMKKFHEELYSTSTNKKLQDDVLGRISSELVTLKRTMDSPVIEFEWNQKYAREANSIGKLTYSQNTSPSFTDLVKPEISGSMYSASDVTMKGTDSSLFIFSKRLYEGLIYRTDVGPIPRDSYCEEHLKSQFSNYSNWRVAIGGCYWCGKVIQPNQYMYVCDKRCYQTFHEWCRRKLSEFCGERLCMYPGCDELLVGDVTFCSEVHQNDLEKKYKTTRKVSISKTPSKSPHWYMDKQTSANQKITNFFPKSLTPSVPQNSNQSLLSGYQSRTELSTSSETLPRDFFKKSSQINFIP